MSLILVLVTGFMLILVTLWNVEEKMRLWQDAVDQVKFQGVQMTHLMEYCVVNLIPSMMLPNSSVKVKGKAQKQ